MWLRDEGVPRTLVGVLSGRLEQMRPVETDVSTALTRAAGDQLATVLHAAPMTRAQALDLLAADAFATYALEAAADDPSTLTSRADEAMRAFAATAER